MVDDPILEMLSLLPEAWRATLGSVLNRDALRVARIPIIRVAVIALLISVLDSIAAVRATITASLAIALRRTRRVARFAILKVAVAAA